MKIKLKPIEQQVVVIFGASSGIGRLTALNFSKKGSKVVAVARDRKGIDSLISEIEKFGGNSLGIVADCCSLDEIKEVASKTISRYGRIDTWVQCAAVTIFSKFEDLNEEEFKRVIDINLMGSARSAWVAIEQMKKSGGSIIFITSVEARRSIPMQSCYASSKHAIEGMLESVRVELLHDKIPISVTNIMPSNIDTPLYDKCRTKVEGGKFKYTGIPPTYSAEIVADAILYAAQHPCRDIVVGTGGWTILWINKFFPNIIDWVFANWGFKYSKTGTRRIKNEDNLDTVLEDYDTIQGDWDRIVLPFSLYNWYFKNRNIFKCGLVTVAIGGTILFKIKSLK